MIPLLLFVQSLSPVVIVVMFLLILGIVLYFFYVYKKEKDFLGSEEKVLSEYEKILSQAHAKARHVIEHASKNAQQMLSRTAFVKSDTILEIHKKLAEETIATMSLYQKELIQMQHQTLTTLQSTVKDVEHLASKELKMYRDTIEKDMTTSRLVLTQETEKTLIKTKEEIEEYKKKRLSEIDRAVAVLIQQLAQELLGKSLSLNDHQALIKTALEKAKEEWTFGL